MCCRIYIPDTGKWKQKKKTIEIDAHNDRPMLTNDEQKEKIAGKRTVKLRDAFWEMQTAGYTIFRLCQIVSGLEVICKRFSPGHERKLVVWNERTN